VLDSHIHIGQFKEEYYNYEKLFGVIFNSNKIDRIIYSSTSCCLDYIKYNSIYIEIYEILKVYPINIALPLFWMIPNFINQGLNINTIMSELPYGGFKLHPYINKWDFEKDIKQNELLHEIFDYAEKNKIHILIHTGESYIDRPNRFEKYFSEYNNVKIILAHCRPSNETIKLMKKYDNIYGDTAFTSSESIKEIKLAGYYDRLIFGTDFPITHYYNKDKNISLEDQYKIDIKYAWETDIKF